MGVLPKRVKWRISETLHEALVDDLDTSFLDDEDVLALMRPTVLLKILGELRDRLAEAVEAKAKAIVLEADLDVEPRENFDDLVRVINAIESSFGEDEFITESLGDARAEIERAIEEVQDRKDKHPSSDDDWDWKDRSPATEALQAAAGLQDKAEVVRSIFSDVDE
jgi:hypothetical protein